MCIYLFSGSGTCKKKGGYTYERAVVCVWRFGRGAAFIEGRTMAKASDVEYCFLVYVPTFFIYIYRLPQLTLAKV